MTSYARSRRFPNEGRRQRVRSINTTFQVIGDATLEPHVMVPVRWSTTCSAAAAAAAVGQAAVFAAVHRLVVFAAVCTNASIPAVHAVSVWCMCLLLLQVKFFTSQLHLDDFATDLPLAYQEGRGLLGGFTIVSSNSSVSCKTPSEKWTEQGHSAIVVESSIRIETACLQSDGRLAQTSPSPAAAMAASHILQQLLAAQGFRCNSHSTSSDNCSAPHLAGTAVPSSARTMHHIHTAPFLCLCVLAVCLQHHPHLRCDCVRGLPEDQVI
jgi:hypothetical protein